MDNDNQNLKENEHSHATGLVHVILSHAYFVFLFAVILGVIFDQMIHFNLFNQPIYQYIGIFMIMIGSIAIYWAQATTRYSNTEAKKERDLDFFLRGPYKYTRNPTNLGLTLMSLGLGLLINSLFSIIFIIITHFIAKLVFVKKQENILKERYGSVYEEYHRKVKDWL